MLDDMVVKRNASCAMTSSIIFFFDEDFKLNFNKMFDVSFEWPIIMLTQIPADYLCLIIP